MQISHPRKYDENVRVYGIEFLVNKKIMKEMKRKHTEEESQ